MKILVVDDDESNLLFTRLELEDEGWQVLAASDGREALALLDGGGPDVAIVDVRLPGMDGITLLKQMKARRPEMPVAIFTGYDEAAVRRPREADAFLIKSSSSAELKGFIKRYSQGK